MHQLIFIDILNNWNSIQMILEHCTRTLKNLLFYIGSKWVKMQVRGANRLTAIELLAKTDSCSEMISLSVV